MKNAHDSDAYDPTITEVMGAIQDLTEAVQTGFAKVEERFTGVEGRLDGVEGRFTGVETILDRHGKLLKVLVAGQDNLTERVNVIDQRLSATQNRVEDIADILEIDHERRIARLEKASV